MQVKYQTPLYAKYGNSMVRDILELYNTFTKYFKPYADNDNPQEFIENTFNEFLEITSTKTDENIAVVVKEVNQYLANVIDSSYINAKIDFENIGFGSKNDFCIDYKDEVSLNFAKDKYENGSERTRMLVAIFKCVFDLAKLRINEIVVYLSSESLGDISKEDAVHKAKRIGYIDLFMRLYFYGWGGHFCRYIVKSISDEFNHHKFKMELLSLARFARYIFMTNHKSISDIGYIAKRGAKVYWYELADNKADLLNDFIPMSTFVYSQYIDFCEELDGVLE